MDTGAYLWIAALAASMVVLHLLVVAYLYRTVGGEVRPDGDEPSGGPGWSLFDGSTGEAGQGAPPEAEQTSGVNPEAEQTSSIDDPGHRRPDVEDTAGDPPANVDADQLTPCPTCGTPNDATYQFCRWCITDLSDTGTSIGGAGGTKRLGS